MEDMEVDDMELDEDMEVDQGRRQRAAKKLANRFAPPPPPDDTMNAAKARDILRHLSELSCGNKISVDNAFDLQGIDALRTIVFSDTAKASALCGEGHFQSAGAGLDISMKIYGKRVDATYNLAYSLGNFKQDKSKGDDADGDDQDEAGRDGTQVEGGAAGEGEVEARATKAKKRQGAASAEATLVEDSELKQRVKEMTFDTDPFFVRTSRLIDENSPQGLLLHNLPVLFGSHVIFDAGVSPQELLERARNNGVAAAAEPANDVMVDLTALPGAVECLAAAASALISPGIEQLYELLQPRPELPGLQVASKVDAEKLLRDALAANERARAEAHRNRTVRQAVRQIEDAMDVDMDDADGGGGGGDGDAGPAGGDDVDGNGVGPQFVDGGGGFGGDGDAQYDDGYDSPGFGAGGGDEDDEPPGSLGGGGTGLGSSQRDGDGVWRQGQERSARTHGGGEEDAGDERAEHPQGGWGSDEESALLSLLSGPAASASVATLQRQWWKSHVKKRTVAGAAAEGAKPRARKPKPEAEPLNWRAAPQPQLEAVTLHTYKTARRDASAKLCLPLEEPARPEALRTYFSAAPATSDLGFPVGGRAGGVLGVLGGGGAASGFACSVQETWRALLIADLQRERQMQRGARAAAGRKSLANGGAAAAGGPPFGGPSASGTDGAQFGMADGGEEYGTVGQDGYAGGGGDGGGGFDDAGQPGPLDDGAGGSYGDYDDDEDEDVSGGAVAAAAGNAMPYATPDGRGPTLEELLQPPRRRVRRLAVKYDKSAGVCDVATLKANLEFSLKELATSTSSQRRQSAPQPPALSFQKVLDRVSAHAAAGDGVAAARPGVVAPARPAASATTNGTTNGTTHDDRPPASFLSGVSTHLAFICLLHLANERGLALRSSEGLDCLTITGLGDLAAAAAAEMAAARG